MAETVLRRAPELRTRVINDLAAFGLRPARGDEASSARAFAARLIGEGIVTAADLGRVQRLSGGAALFVAHEEAALTGVLAFVLLNAAGHRAVLDGTFDAQAPAAAHVARPGERAEAFYGWGVAATTKDTARRLIPGARAVMAGACGGLPKYARPTTADGHRLMRERLGFADLPGSDGLVWQAPLAVAVAA
jgi:hypothetical protein